MMINNRLKELIDASGKTMYAVAKETGLNYQTVHSLAVGNANRVDLKTLEKLCKALGVKVGDILVYEESETPTVR